MVRFQFRPDFRWAFRLTLQLAAYLNAFGLIVYLLEKTVRGYHPDWTTPTYWTALRFATASLLSCGVVWERERRREKESWHVAGYWRLPPPGQTLPYLLVLAGAIIVLSDLNNLVGFLIPLPERYAQLFEQLIPNPTAALLGAVIIVPIAEELVFRGLVLRRLLGTRSATQAIVLSAILFALVHVNPWQAIPAFFSGLLFGWAYVRTRSLGLCIVAHALNNAGAAFSRDFPFVINGFNSGPSPGILQFQPGWFLWSGVALLVMGVVIFARTTSKPAPAFPA